MKETYLTFFFKQCFILIDNFKVSEEGTSPCEIIGRKVRKNDRQFTEREVI